MNRWKVAAAAAVLMCVMLAVGQTSTTEAQEGPQTPAGETNEGFTPRGLGMSWKDIATGHMEKKDYPETVYWYRRWLEANPRDNHGWYNLACTYMYLDQKEKALDAFEACIETGWSDLAWAKEDPDFESIREEPRFVNALAWAETQKPQQKFSERRFVSMTSMGTYVSYLPPDYVTSGETRFPMVVILHGHGSTETAHGDGISTMLGRDGVVYIAIRFPYGNLQAIADTARIGFTIRPPETVPGHEPFGTFAAFVDACIADALATYRVDPTRVFVLGHSQGGGAAGVYGVKFPKRAKGVLVHAGFLVEGSITDADLKRAKDAGVAIEITHCTGDTNVPVERGRALYDLLHKGGVNANMYTVDGDSHGFAPVREYVRDWVNVNVRGLKGE